MVDVPPVRTLDGSAEHEITGGRGSLTVKLALHVAEPFLLPSAKFAPTAYEPGCNPVVSICVEASLPPTFTPVPFQLYLTVRFGLKLEPVAVTVTDSPANTSAGCIAQAALGGGGGAPPPIMKLRPVCSRTPLMSVFAPLGGVYL